MKHVKLNEVCDLTLGDFKGRGNTLDGNNPFTFFCSLEMNVCRVRYDGYAPVTADKAKVRKDIKSHFTALRK